MQTTEPTVTTTDLLPIEWIQPSSLNPRKRFDQAALEDLAESIRQHGIIEPIVVREIDFALFGMLHQFPDGASAYEIIAGERRFRAAQLAGLTEVPIRNLGSVDDADALKLALIENLQRQDLDPIEEAEGYRQLNKIVGLKQAAIAAAVNRSQPAVANAMRLLDLPEDVQERIRTRELSVSHGIALAKHKDFPAVVQAIADLAVKEELNAHQLEKLKPNDYRLRQGGTGPVRSIQYAQFDRTICKACPFGAYRAGSGSYDYDAVCLNPTHFDELNAAAKHQEQAERAVVVAAVAADGPGSIIKLDALKWDEYTQCYGNLPGCDELCPCRRMGEARGGALVPVCIDKDRHRKLVEVQRAEEQAYRDERHALGLERVLSQIDLSSEDINHRMLAIVASHGLQWADASHVKAAVERLYPAFEVGKWQSKSKADIARQLLDLPRYLMVELALETILRSELSYMLHRNDMETPFTDLFMGDEPVSEAGE